MPNETAAPQAELKTVVKFGEKEVSFGTRAKSVKEVTDSGVSFFVKNGVAVTVNLGDLSEAMIRRLALHGLAQKVGDEAAGVDELDDIVESFEEMKRRLMNGDWGAERKAGEGKGASVLAQALVRVTGQTIEQVRATLAKLSNGEKAKLRQVPKVREAIQEIEAEKARNADPAAGEALLAQFGA